MKRNANEGNDCWRIPLQVTRENQAVAMSTKSKDARRILKAQRSTQHVAALPLTADDRPAMSVYTYEGPSDSHTPVDQRTEEREMEDIQRYIGVDRDTGFGSAELSAERLMPWMADTKGGGGAGDGSYGGAFPKEVERPLHLSHLAEEAADMCANREDGWKVALEDMPKFAKTMSTDLGLEYMAIFARRMGDIINSARVRVAERRQMLSVWISKTLESQFDTDVFGVCIDVTVDDEIYVIIPAFKLSENWLAVIRFTVGREVMPTDLADAVRRGVDTPTTDDDMRPLTAEDLMEVDESDRKQRQKKPGLPPMMKWISGNAWRKNSFVLPGEDWRDIYGLFCYPTSWFLLPGAVVKNHLVA